MVQDTVWAVLQQISVESTNQLVHIIGKIMENNEVLKTLTTIDDN